MKILRKVLFQRTAMLSFSLAFSAAGIAGDQQYLGQYFSKTVFAGEIRSSGVSTAILTDSDLIRGNNEEETIFQGSVPEGSQSFQLFDGYLVYDTVNFRAYPTMGEASVTVFFDDGSALYDVNSIIDRFAFYGSTTLFYLLDQNELISAGKTIHDIVDVSLNDLVDHDLNYSDFGFGNIIEDNSSPEAPDVEAPDNEEDTTIVGTAGRDDLRGSEKSEIFLGFGGERDVFRGNGGDDIFVFGAEAGDSKKDRDIIVDFNVFDDTLVLEEGASIAASRINNGTLVIKLAGSDGDIIRLRNVDTGVDSINIVELDGEF
ncbi:hypothetical protein OLMES_1656 [Oleiphilus messinensis]|uniref:Calcium-binding protein n=1 Tax=Oleiphilus messinensis TaxID=141451 RepID=A0A1Y0I5N6_9GAMM|nr:hypothetical protein [Oleiphilus messinensis]ARU55731.1 hypothetical protein OLMES_1656 [Oleiphilus messinensis]